MATTSNPESPREANLIRFPGGWWKPARRTRRLAGFTLIEVMIVAAIIGILAAIAYPSYQESVRKTRRADAKAVLMELAQFMERRFTESLNYAGALPASLTVSPKGADGSAVYYTITATNQTATTYTLNAAPANAQTSDRCGTLILTHMGLKNISGAKTGVTPADCW
jgi:type IV pilus assembly protein PilE